ncbi:unnamed protein product [Calypogeia fissa]
MVTDGRRKVMIAVDDSEVSSYAFTWGIRNLIRTDDHVVVLTAAPFTGVDFPTADMATGTEYGGKGVRMSDILVAGTEYGVPIIPTDEDAEAADISITSSSKNLVNKYLQLLLQSNISCEGEVVKGDAGSWIADEGERLKADVIIVGSSASGLVKRALLGSISDYVLHNAPCTVAVVRQSEEALSNHDPLASSGGPRKIVVAVDESKEAINAFKWALKNFCTPQDHVVVYHVHQPYVAPITGVGTGEFGIEEVYTLPDVAVKDEVASLKDSQKVVEKFMEFAQVQTEIKCEGMVVSGQTQEKVIEGLTALRADAVVVGTHDRSAVSRTFLGSVSDHLAHNSPCPLIVVKTGKNVPEPELGHQHVV